MLSLTANSLPASGLATALSCTRRPLTVMPRAIHIEAAALPAAASKAAMRAGNGSLDADEALESDVTSGISGIFVMGYLLVYYKVFMQGACQGFDGWLA